MTDQQNVDDFDELNPKDFSARRYFTGGSRERGSLENGVPSRMDIPLDIGVRMVTAVEKHQNRDPYRLIKKRAFIVVHFACQIIFRSSRSAAKVSHAKSAFHTMMYSSRARAIVLTLSRSTLDMVFE